MTIHARSLCLCVLAALTFSVELVHRGGEAARDDRLDGVGGQRPIRSGSSFARRARNRPARSWRRRGPAPGGRRRRARARSPASPRSASSERTPLWPPWPPPAPSLRRPNGRSSSSCTTIELGDRHLPEAGDPRHRLSADVHELHRLAEKDALARHASTSPSSAPNFARGAAPRARATSSSTTLNPRLCRLSCVLRSRIAEPNHEVHARGPPLGEATWRGYFPFFSSLPPAAVRPPRHPCRRPPAAAPAAGSRRAGRALRRDRALDRGRLGLDLLGLRRDDRRDRVARIEQRAHAGRPA